ncbi:MAG: histidine phosphatase family protein [Ktedonobacteraceae bacterium]|nr:histidine phosphatase family protein [Ktedonobacteraceae bacterium]
MHEQDPFLLKREHAAELFLIRHGDAIPEADEIIPSGIYNNLPLSKKGREQARVLAERLKYLHFDAAYSSPLRRCQETAAPLLEALGLQATIVEDIREVQTRSGTQIPEVQDGDDLSILTRALHARQAEMTRIAALTGHWNDVIMGETSAGFRRRVVEAIDGIAKRHRGARVLVFAHGGVINAYAAEALGLERDFFFPCANTSITIVRVSGEKRVLYVLNDVAHLKMY